MCLIVFSWQPDSAAPLVLLANRDEFYERPTRPMQWWPDAPALLAGQDLRGGGTWLGVTRDGRFAALTNFRDGRAPKPTAGTPSRGRLVSDFLQDDPPGAPNAYLDHVAAGAMPYAGFNLLAGDLGHGQFACLSSRTGAITSITPGLHGLSNALLDTPWPKVEHRKHALAQALASNAGDDDLLALMHDTTVAPDDLLPDTGIDPVRERALSSAFIRAPGYGTRCTTLIRLTADGRLSVIEETHDPQDGVSERRQFDVVIEPRAPRAAW